MGTKRPSRFAEFTFEEVTRLRYADAAFVEAFRRLRGNCPRPHETRWLQRLLASARARREMLGLRETQPLLILDAGTGYGRDLAWLKAQPGVRAFGIDYSLAMLQVGRQALGLDEGALVQMDIRRLGLREASIDVVRAQALFHHLTRRAADAAMGELVRILKPAGLLYLFVRYGRQEGFVNESGLGPRYFRHFTLTSLRTLIRRHGLRELEYERLTAPPRLPCVVLLAEKPPVAR
jgi:SAM-dependent methyltransferase